MPLQRLHGRLIPTPSLVPREHDNPFYDQAFTFLKKAEAELKGAIKCLYIGPNEHGGGDEQAQIVGDLITKKVDGIAVSPANAAAMTAALPGAEAADVPIITWDSIFSRKTRACAPLTSARTIMTSASISRSS